MQPNAYELIRPSESASGAGGWAVGSMPVVASLGYACLALANYRELLAFDLTYIGPALPQLPEDILGLGFLTLWLPYCFVWAFTQVAAAIYSPRWLIAVSIAVFGIVSVLDLLVFGVLEAHVMGALGAG